MPIPEQDNTPSLEPPTAVVKPVDVPSVKEEVTSDTSATTEEPMSPEEENEYEFVPIDDDDSFLEEEIVEEVVFDEKPALEKSQSNRTLPISNTRSVDVASEEEIQAMIRNVAKMALQEQKVVQANQTGGVAGSTASMAAVPTPPSTTANNTSKAAVAKRPSSGSTAGRRRSSTATTGKPAANGRPSSSGGSSRSLSSKQRGDPPATNAKPRGPPSTKPRSSTGSASTAKAPVKKQRARPSTGGTSSTGKAPATKPANTGKAASAKPRGRPSTGSSGKSVGAKVAPSGKSPKVAPSGKSPASAADKNKDIEKLPSEKNLTENDMPDEKKRNRKRALTWGFVLSVVLIIPALVAVYFFVLKTDQDPIAPSLLAGNQTRVPTAQPTPAPTQTPTFRGETRAPSKPPTPPPTGLPTSNLAVPLRNFLAQDYGVNVGASASPEVHKAIDWLVEEAEISNNSQLELNAKSFQRFSILVVYYNIFSEDNEATTGNAKRGNLLGTSRLFNNIILPNWGMRNQDECFWMGMTCDSEGKLNEIRLPDIGLDGVLPTELGYLSDLKYLDMSNNNMQGTIPDEIYGIAGLEKIYLYHNQLTGSISDKIGDNWSLTHFHVSHNGLTGSIPATLASRSLIRPMRKSHARRSVF